MCANTIFLLVFFSAVLIIGHTATAATAAIVNNRPVIGILAQPTGDNKASYIAASYVKYIESSGGRVVPIDYRWSTEKLRSVFSKVNGILFPGGGAPLTNSSQYMQVQRLFFDLTKKANDEGVYYPLWATCLGFEAIAIIAANDYNLLQDFDAWNISLPLEFAQAYKSSRIFGNMSDQLISIFKNQAVTQNNHHYGVGTARWNANARLTAFYNVLSVNKDRNGKEFVSTIEAKKYPIYGSQWHPEKPMFEWKPVGINHGADSIRANLEMSQFFVNEARRNSNSFASHAEEWKYLIYNFTPTFTFEDESFVQTYFFN